MPMRGLPRDPAGPVDGGPRHPLSIFPKRSSNVRKALVLAGLAGLLALTACGKEATSTAANSAVAPTTTASTAATTTAAATPEAPADPVLGPDGFGAYKLGMSPEDGKTAGLAVTEPSRAKDPNCPNAATIPGQEGFPLIMFSTKHGLSAIEAKGDMHTPEGIKVDSTLAALKKAYPKLTNPLHDPNFNGENFVPVPGNPKAKYRMFVVVDTVRYVHLILADNDCSI
jgi:hypothetical protein